MTLKFPDLSHYKPGVDVALWPALITKATEGTTFTDSTYAGYKAAAARAGIPFAGYHFLAHGVDVVAQAKHAYAVIGHIPAMLDVETGTSGNATLAEVVGFVKAYRALGGTLTLIYLPKWYWSGHWGSPSLQPLQDLGLALISSAYTAYSDSGIGWNSYGGMAPAIWQYTSTPMDMNAFRGTITQLSALFSGSSGDPSTTGSTDVALTPDEITAIANKVWTFKPGWNGLLDETPLGMLADLRVVRDQLVAGAHTLDEIAAACAAAVVAALPPSSGTVDVDALATAVADKLAARLES